jgi:hypothetical protein
VFANDSTIKRNGKFHGWVAQHWLPKDVNMFLNKLEKLFKTKIEITIIKPRFFFKLRPQGAISMEKLSHSPHM